MTLSFFLLCGLVPLAVTAVGLALCAMDERKEQQSRAAGRMPLPGHIFAAKVMFQLFLPAGFAWMAWLGWGALTWLQAAINAALHA